MRLLNTRTLQFQEFFDSQIPMYAILSHRWGNEEVTFQEFRKGKKQHHEGFVKIEQCCVLASSRGFQWVWIDTCCIDKKSSAELSEAINSMWRWYEGALECYVYLSDVTWESRDIEASKKEFGQSLWFTRGWTLQELLAPAHVIFFDKEWMNFGTKVDLRINISAVTGIEAHLLYISLKNPFDSYLPCVAKKMSWLSRRVTSRAEDMAYCMLGLFDVNMPLLYGEGGQKAFLRLQLEIIRKSDDESIFAWTSNQISNGMLAPQPSCFADSWDISIYGKSEKKRFPYLMTNQGLEFQVPIRRPVGREASEYYDLSQDRISLALKCWRDGEQSCAITIVLARFSRTWQRIQCGKLESIESVKDSMSEDGRFKYTAALHIQQDGL